MHTWHGKNIQSKQRDMIILENVLCVTISVKISMRHKQWEEHKFLYFSSKAIFKTILRMENTGQIHQNIKSVKLWHDQSIRTTFLEKKHPN